MKRDAIPARAISLCASLMNRCGPKEAALEHEHLVACFAILKSF
jgi:hypothetical protein